MKNGAVLPDGENIIRGASPYSIERVASRARHLPPEGAIVMNDYPVRSDGKNVALRATPNVAEGFARSAFHRDPLLSIAMEDCPVVSDGKNIVDLDLTSLKEAWQRPLAF